MHDNLKMSLTSVVHLLVLFALCWVLSSGTLLEDHEPLRKSRIQMSKWGKITFPVRLVRLKTGEGNFNRTIGKSDGNPWMKKVGWVGMTCKSKTLKTTNRGRRMAFSNVCTQMRKCWGAALWGSSGTFFGNLHNHLKFLCSSAHCRGKK